LLGQSLLALIADNILL